MERKAWEPPYEFDEYRLIQRLGAGRMGAVYLANDRLLDRAVAIKFLTSRLTENARQRFVVEARAAARIQHPNVMVIHRVGELDDHPYIVSEYVRGRSLAEFGLPLTGELILSLGVRLARGLATAHRQGVLHRDIKLANVAIDEESNEPKLLDFSLAKIEMDEGLSPDEDGARPVERAVPLAIENIRLSSSDFTDTDTDADTITLVPGTDDVAVAADQGTLLDSAARLDGDWKQGTASLTQAGTLVGTPHYMAPELWRTEPASRETDIYALGVLLYILCAGMPPYAALSPVELATRSSELSPVPLREAAPSVDPRLATIIERCLQDDPTERFRTGDALREALEELLAGERRPRSVSDNPYRGLQAFEAEHRDLFFGRGAELRTVLDRLRADSFVLIAGDSGVGKSSLCRAGVGPSIVDGAIEPERQWSYATMTPGRHPLRSLVSVLASHFDFDHDVILPAVENHPDTLGWLIHKKLGHATGKLLLIDQFEELVTLSDRDEAKVVGKILSQFAAGIPGVRLLATVRGDFLTRTADIPYIGDELSRAIYLLRPLSPAGVREAIVGPAEAMDVHYESSELVEGLVASGIESSLPILQFALAELWEARNIESQVISASDLDGIGGVTGALAGHAEGLMTSLLPRQRIEAKELLLRLVTLDNTRASLALDELVQDNEDSRLALETLVRGRLLVVRENDQGTVYEIAHEALIREWSNLRRWLEEAAEVRALRHRLDVAAAEWDRLGHPRTVLWRSAQLTEAAQLDHRSLRPRETEFLAQSKRAVARGRLTLRVAAVMIPGALALTYGLVRYQAHAELQQRVDERLGEAMAGLERAQASSDAFAAAQTAALKQYDVGADEPAREAWAEAQAEAQTSDLELATAARELERALTLDPTRDDVRDLLGDTLLQRAELAERRLDEARVAELIERLSLYDESGERMAKWTMPAHLSIDTTPPGATVELVEYQLDQFRRRVASDPRSLGTSPLESLELPMGSYQLHVEVDGRPPVLYPIVLGRGESLSVSLEVPPAEAIPPGFVFIPEGRFLRGCSNETLCEMLYDSVPIHQVSTDSFLIARHEVTFREWIDFLENTPVERRVEFTPRIDQGFVPVSLAPVETGGWSLAFPREGQDTKAHMGELLTIEGRDRRMSQDWLQMPVVAINFEVASAYLEWLDRSGRLPGARHCTDHEWERAGRGADSRLYPHGDHIDPDDANLDITYGKSSETAGPDVVGSHPVSRSPFGVDDLSGNVGEWTTDPLHGDASILRGGAFALGPINARLVIRQPVPPDFTEGSIGMRVCAPFPLPRSVGEPKHDE